MEGRVLISVVIFHLSIAIATCTDTDTYLAM